MKGHIYFAMSMLSLFIVLPVNDSFGNLAALFPILLTFLFFYLALNATGCDEKESI